MKNIYFLLNLLLLAAAKKKTVELNCVAKSNDAPSFAENCAEDDFSTIISQQSDSWGVCLFPEMQLQLVLHLKSILSAKISPTSRNDFPTSRIKRSVEFSVPLTFQNGKRLKRSALSDDFTASGMPQMLMCPLSRLELDSGSISASSVCGNSIKIAPFASCSISNAFLSIACEEPQDLLPFTVMSHGRFSLSAESDISINSGSMEIRGFSDFSAKTSTSISVTTGGRLIVTGLWRITGPAVIMIQDGALVRSADQNFATRPQIEIAENSTLQIVGKDTYAFLEWVDFRMENSLLLVSDKGNFIVQSSKLRLIESEIIVSNGGFFTLTTQGSPASSAILNSFVTVNKGSLIIRDLLDLGENSKIEVLGETSRFQVNRLETSSSGNSQILIQDSRITIWDKLFVSKSLFSVHNSTIEGSKPAEMAMIGSVFRAESGSRLEMLPYSTVSFGGGSRVALVGSEIKVDFKASFLVKDSALFDEGLDSPSELTFVNSNITIAEAGKFAIGSGVKLRLTNLYLEIGFRAELSFQSSPRLLPGTEEIPNCFTSTEKCRMLIPHGETIVYYTITPETNLDDFLI